MHARTTEAKSPGTGPSRWLGTWPTVRLDRAPEGRGRTRKLALVCSLALSTACGSTSATGGTGMTGTTGTGGATGTSGATGTGGAASTGTSTTTGTATTSTSSSGAGGATGTGGGTGAGGGCATDPTFAMVLSKPLSGCAGYEPPCHNSNAAMLHINPADPAATWAALVNVTTYTTGAGKRVVPGDPAHSFLYRKLTNDLTPDEGLPMPASGLGSGWKELAPDEIEMVRCWILGGAKNN
jgi:hypothetical protein